MSAASTYKNPARVSGLRLLSIAFLCLIAAAGAARAQVTFSNATPILVPATGTSGAASPYPSNITVAGLTGNTTKVTVTLNNVNHTFPDDIDILLVSPTGQRFVMMSDAGGAPDLVNVNITLDDAAAAQLPDSTLIASGTYRPTNFGAGDTFAAPAPAVAAADNAAPAGTATFASQFNGASPNGTWSLYVVDDSNLDSGNINGGWSLTITAATAPTAGESTIGGRVLRSNGRPIINATVTLVGGNFGEPLTVRTNANGYYRFTNVPVGETYVVTASSPKYKFAQPSQAVNFNGDDAAIDFAAVPTEAGRSGSQ